jgi:glycosyltransferase involved in cell wall biosynthesis
MVEALRWNSRETSATWMHAGDADRADRFLDRADALVVCRAFYSAPLARLVARARARGLRVLYDVDDLVFDIKQVHLVVDALDQDTNSDATWDAWFGWIGRYQAALRLCEGAIVTNNFLAARVQACIPEMSVRVIQNFLNRKQQEFSRALFEAKRKGGFASDGLLHIGYFSGTPSHNRDFAIAAKPLERLLDTERNAVLRIVGFVPPTAGLARHTARIETHPLQDFMNLQRLIAEVEINIAPLQDNTFTNCKSELKYFEAAIVGTPTVATPTHTFARAMRDGEDGYLARAHEWDAKLAEAVELVRSPARYVAMAELGFAQTEERYSWNRQVTAIETAVFDDISPSVNALSAPHPASVVTATPAVAGHSQGDEVVPVK